jgi:dCMP deaminase
MLNENVISRTAMSKTTTTSKKTTKQSHTRPTWDEYFINLMEAVALRATCDRGRAAAIIVKDRRVLATGYVGSSVGMPHCDEVGHDMRKTINDAGEIKEHCVRTIHAEQNAICQAAKFGTSIDGATIYTKMEPCATCAKMIVNCGIVKVVCQRRYHAAQDTRKIFRKAKVELVVLENEVEKYDRQ